MKKYSRINSLYCPSEKIRTLIMPSACLAAKGRKGAASGPKTQPNPKPQHEKPEDWAGSINFLQSEEFMKAVEDRKCPLETCIKTYRWPFRSSVISVLDRVLENKEAREYAMSTPAYSALVNVGLELIGGDIQSMAREVVKVQKEYKYTGVFKWVSKRGIDMAMEELTKTARWFYVKGRGVPGACRIRFILLILHMYNYTAHFGAV